MQQLQSRTSWASRHLGDALRDAVPVAFSIATYGVVFGALAHQVGLGVFDVLAMSALVFSGSAQFIALPLLHAGVGPLDLFLTTLVLSLRHLVMGVSLAPHLRQVPLGWRMLLAHGLNDEAYALTTGHAARVGFHPTYMLGSSLATFLAWMVGTATGALLGSTVTQPEKWGLDFAFPAVFIALLVPQVKGRAGTAAAIVASAVALGAAPLLGSGGAVLAAALAAAGVGGVLSRES